MELKQVFINGSGRLRSGWRFAVFIAAFVAFMFLVGVLNLVAINAGLLKLDDEAGLIAFGDLPAFIGALAIGWFCGKFLEGDLPFRALGAWFTKGWLKHLLLGCLIGTATIGLAALISHLAGGLSFTLDVANSEDAILKTLLISLIIFVIGAAFEESLFRGYILQTFVREDLGWFAIALTAVTFGLVHLGNRDADLFSTINTMLAGVWLGVAYLKTRDLWFPFGIHFIWNWVQGSIFGIEVSGITRISPAPVLNEIDHGPAWLTGAGYGIEASVACTIALLISIAVVWFTPILRPSAEMLALTGKKRND